MDTFHPAQVSIQKSNRRQTVHTKMTPKHQKLDHRPHKSREVKLFRILLLSSVILIHQNVALAVTKPTQVSTAQASQNMRLLIAQPTNGTSAVSSATATNSDQPSYIQTGRKISKILNDFFDVSNHSPTI